MAEYYANASAGGGGVGSVVDPFTFAEAVVFINASLGNGDGMNLQNTGGTYTTADVAITVAGAVASFKHLRGCTTTAGDGGKATIQRSSGVGILLDINQYYWKVSDIIFDGQGAGYALRLKIRSIGERLEAYGFSVYAFSGVGMWFNCYAHDNTGGGFAILIAVDCISESNGGFGYTACDTIRCIGKGNANFNFNVDLSSAHGLCIDCISDGGSVSGINAYYGAIVINPIVVNSPSGGHYGIWTRTDGVLIKNAIFHNNNADTNDLTLIDGYKIENPHFIDAANWDYRIKSRALRGTGFSQVGMQTPYYALTPGLDQVNIIVPASGDVIDTEDEYGYSGDAWAGRYEPASVDDVEEGVTYGDDGEFTGLFGVPSESEVEEGVGYGAGPDTEFTGTLETMAMPISVQVSAESISISVEVS